MAEPIKEKEIGMTQAELNAKVNATFSLFNVALLNADTRRGYNRMTGMNTPSQNDVIQKFKNIFASISEQAKMYGLDSQNLKTVIASLPDKNDLGIFD